MGRTPRHLFSRNVALPATRPASEGPSRALRLLSLVALIALALAPAGVAIAATHKKPPVKVTHLSDDFFNKGKLTIKKGTVVNWQWHTDDEHTVTEIHGKYSSNQTSKGNYRHRFKKKGTFTVYCAVHPTVMRQKIVVK